MPASRKPTVRRRMLGAELRRLREAAGLSGEKVARELECSDSKISRIENGLVPAHPRDVRDMLDLYGVTDEGKREALITLARDGKKRGWWQRYQAYEDGVLPGPYLDLISLEADAASIRTYQPQIVPGLLQTEAYVRAMIEAARVEMSPEEIQTVVEVRLARQAVLTRQHPLHFWAVLDEAVLRRMVGGPEVMRDQLRHLAAMARRQNVTLQVLPFAAGAPAWVYTPFVILKFPEPADLEVVYLENLTSGLYVEETAEVDRYTLMFDHLRAAALSPKESVALIAEVADHLE